MHFQTLHIEQFAGLSGYEITFQDGINVLLGPNEAGKSTVIHALSAILFLPTDTKGRGMQAKRALVNRFLPLFGGNTCRVKLVFISGEAACYLEKQWGANAFTSLTINGSIYTGDADVARQLEQLLSFSPATYESLVFAKQETFKQTILSIQQSGADSIADFLSKAALDMGGVSIPALKEKLACEYSRLTGNWDMNLLAPMNGRGLDNRYVKGNGSIIEHYYGREESQRKLHTVSECEENTRLYARKIQEVQQEIDACRQELHHFSDISGLLVIRREKEKTLRGLEKKKDYLSSIKQDWICLDEDISNLQKKKTGIQERITEFTADLLAAEQYAYAQTAQKRLDKICALQQNADMLSDELDRTIPITIHDVHTLRRYEQSIYQFELEQASSKIAGKVMRSALPVFIRTPDHPPVQIETDFETDGRLTLLIGDIAELDIRAGNFTSEQQTQYEIDKALYQSECSRLSVADSAEADERQRKYETAQSTLAQIHQQIADVLGEDSIASLKKLLSAQPSAESRDIILEKLEQERYALAQTDLFLEQAIKKRTKYEQEFSVYNKLLLEEQELTAQIHPLEQELQQLPATCPNGFENADAFVVYMNEIQEKLHVLEQKLVQLQHEYTAFETDVSSEELQQLAQRQDALMREDIRRAQSVRKIMDAVEKTIDHLEQTAYKVLEQKFDLYLQMLTNGRYHAEKIGQDLHFALRRGNIDITPEHLSAGTSDALALAFRFAMLDEVMGRDGLCVLDDCLVDLDDSRRTEAVRLIQKYSEHHQVIFATCNPVSAEQLGGNIINMNGGKYYESNN